MKKPTNHAYALLSVEFNRIVTLLQRQDLRENDRSDWIRRLEEVKHALSLFSKNGLGA